MRTSRLLATLVGAAAVASLAASCGDNSARCGDGTTEVDGVCVPDSLLDCGEGTVEMDGECVPDGSVICEQGTVYDETVGGCVVDPSACAEGTVLVDGECVPEDDTLTADLEEEAEPNDGTQPTDDIAGQLALPAVGESTVIHGCIDPYRDLDDNGNPDPDLDLWIVTTTGPALVDITADGVGGLAAGYQVIAATDNPLVDSNFVRFGLNLTGDTSSRQVYLPAAGVYGLFMADGRSLFLQDGAAGGPEACYYATISNVALPAPTAVTVNTDIAGTHDGDVDFYEADAAECSFFIGVHDMQAAAAISSIWAVRNDEVFEYAEPDGAGTPGVVRTGGLADADTVTYVIDPVYNYALAPVDYSLRVIAPAAGALPTDGSTVNVTNIDTGEDLVACFDTTADTMHHFTINADNPVDLIFIDAHGNLVTFQASDFADWIKFPTGDRYHVVIDTTELAADVATIVVDSEIVNEAITPIVPGTLIDDHAFNDLGATWHSFDPGSEIWLEIAASATAWGSDVTLDFLPLAGVGVPYQDFDYLFYMDIPSDGSEPAGRIVYEDPMDYLVRVDDYWDEIADATSTYDLDVDDRVFTDLGTASEDTPIALDAQTVASGDSVLYFLRATGGDEISVTATPTDFDVAIELLDADEFANDFADTGFEGDPETLETVVTSPAWVALRVSNLGGTGTAFDLDITTVSPDPYTVTTGAIAYQDICDDSGAVVLDQTPAGIFGLVGDEAVTDPQDAPTGFTLHGETVGQFYVSTNGFLSFEAAVDDAFFSNTGIPNTAAPNSLVAPFWDDLDSVEICLLDNGTDTVTVQWTGVRYFTTEAVQLQAMLHSSGVIEFVYGSGHAADGFTATVGTETSTGYFGTQIGFNMAGTTPASSSRVLTPAP
jgi:hypothetical protein